MDDHFNGEDIRAPGFLIFREDVDALRASLSDAQFGALIRCVSDYAGSGNVPAFPEPTVAVGFSMLRGKIDHYLEQYRIKIEQTREAGKASAAKRALQGKGGQRALTSADERQQTQTQTKTQNKTEKSSLLPPSLSAIEAEAQRLGLGKDVAARFLADCEAANWADGHGEQIRDWKRYLAGYFYARRAGSVTSPPALSYDQRHYSPGELSALTDADFEVAASRTEGGDDG